MDHIQQAFCPTCERIFSIQTLYCSHDGTKLIQPTKDSIVGVIFNNRYKIVKKIGQGGMGTVYMARQLSTNSFVAIKIIAPSLSKNSDMINRFKREVKLQSMLEHPNIVTLIDFESNADNQYYFVMKFVEGQSLTKQLKDSGLFSLDLFFDLTLQMCDAIAYAHSKGIIHRDLKSDNIIMVSLTHQKIIKILDFGLAKAIDDSNNEIEKLTKEGITMGSPSFISPEQARGELDNISTQSDIYSLGIIFYQMITGQLPFKADSVWMILKKQMSEKPVPPRKLNPDISRKLNNIILKCINKNPFERYASVVEIKHDLLEISPPKKLVIKPESQNSTKEPKEKKRVHISSNRNKLIVLFVIMVVLYLSTFSNRLISIVFKEDSPNAVLTPENRKEVSIKTNSIKSLVPVKEKVTGYPPLKIQIGKHPYDYKLPYTACGSLKLLTIPTKADIFSNNHFLGKSPLSINYLLPGVVTLTIKKEKFISQEIELLIKSGQKLRPSIIELKSETGHFYLKVNMISPDIISPVKGQVKIGSMAWKEVDIPFTENNLRCGIYQISLKVNGFRVLSAKSNLVNITYGETQEIEFDLKGDPDYFYIRGRDFFFKKQFFLAINELKKAIGIAPSYKDLYFWIGKAYEAFGDYENAALSYKKFLSFPNIEYEKKKALSLRLLLLEKENKEIDFFLLAGLNSFKADNFPLAYQNLSKALKINPKNILIYFWRAKTLFANKQFKSALFDLEEIIKLAPSNKLAYYERGRVYIHNGQHELAISDFSHAITFDDAYADAHFDRGQSYYKTGMFDLAVSDFYKAIQLDPRRFALLSYQWLGKIFEVTNKFSEAVTAYETCINLFPENHIDWDKNNNIYFDKIKKLKEKMK